MINYTPPEFDTPYNHKVQNQLIMPLEIETGRWQNKPAEERICKVCESGEVENEFHFIFSYTL